ncbi:hypothetical protein ACRC6Q_19065 [Planococcus sp. SE5232]|uniref:hypothetical protein n=1 Tax=unclassified Planococcus (in: firmicutes) TaxID=2662419 RepID=UPI003D6ADE4C
MSSGNVGQDDLIEILENLFKAMSKRKAMQRSKNDNAKGANGHIKADPFNSVDRARINAGLDPMDSNEKSVAAEKNILLPEDRLSKEEDLIYLKAYSNNLNLEKYNLKLDSEMINEKELTLSFKGDDNGPDTIRYSLTYNLEADKGSIKNHYFGEEKGSFQTLTSVEERFSKEELKSHYENLYPDKIIDSQKDSVGKKINLVDSMTSYAQSLNLEGYHLSSKSITENKAMLFFKHKENPGDVKEVSYNLKTETGKVTHLLSNKENNYANQKTVSNEFDKAELERHGFGKTLEQIALENEKQKLNTEDTSEETEITYNQKVLDSKLGKSVTNQILANPDLLKGAVALYQLGSMRKLLSHSKDQLENLNSLLNKKDANFEKIYEIKDSLSLQIDALQEKVSDLEKNQETSKTYEKLNEGFQKDQDDQFEKSRENTPTRTVEIEHSL